MKLNLNITHHLGRISLSGSAFMLILISFLFSVAVYKIDNANSAKSNHTSAQVARNSERIAVLSWTQCVQTRSAVGAANDRWDMMRQTLLDSANTLDQLAFYHADGQAKVEHALADEWRAMSGSIFRYPLQDCGPKP